MEGLFTFSLSQQGKTHIDRGVVCQDYSDSFSDDRCAVIAVSDGHGSENFVRSDRGSKYACEAAFEAAKDFLNSIVVFDTSDALPAKDDNGSDCVEQPSDEQYVILSADNQDEIITQLCKNILVRWNEKVRKDYERDLFSEEEVKNVNEKYRNSYLCGEKQEHAYGATLQLVILTRHYFLGIRNGDGECVSLDKDGRFYTPIPDNELCEANYTTSLCDSTAIDDFRYVLIFKDDPLFPLAVFLGSDGVDNSYINNEELFSLYSYITRRAINDGTEKMVLDVARVLEVLTDRGSGDDVSIAGILDIAALPQISDILEADADRRRRAIEEQKENKRRAQKERKMAAFKKKLDYISDDYQKFVEDISKFENSGISDFNKNSISVYEELKQRQQILCEEIKTLGRSLAEINGVVDERFSEWLEQLKVFFPEKEENRFSKEEPTAEQDEDQLPKETASKPEELREDRLEDEAAQTGDYAEHE